jgi:hypothetical protein
VLELHRQLVRRGDVPGHPLHPGHHVGPPLGRQRADRALEERGVGDDVVGGAGGEVRDGEHGRVEDRCPPGHHRLQREHDLSGDRHGVGRRVRHRRVSAAAADGHQPVVRGRHHRPGSHAHHAAGLGGEDVQRERPAHRRLRNGVEQSLLEHVPGAVVALLPRLQHEHDLAGELVAALGQQAGGAQQHRRVQVVAAGVHRPGHLRGERQTGVLLHRQGVHVGAQQVARAGPGAAQDADGGGGRRPDGHLDRQPGQLLQHGGLGARQLQPDLRVAVQPAAQVDGPVGVRVRRGEQRRDPLTPHPSRAHGGTL